MNVKKCVALILFVVMLTLWRVTNFSFIWIYFLSGILTFLITSVFTPRGVRFKISRCERSHFISCFSFGILGLFLVGITNPTKENYIER